MVKTQKCENSREAKMRKWSKRKNVKTVKREKHENDQNAKIRKLSKEEKNCKRS